MVVQRVMLLLHEHEVQRVMFLLHEHEEWSLDLEHPHKILASVVGRGKGSLKPDG